MNISQRGINFIKKHEGLKLYRSADSNSGKDSVGYGHQVQPGEHLAFIDLVTAENLLIQDLSKAVIKVSKAIKVDLTQSQFDALVSFAFNTGASSSTLYDLINEGKFELNIVEWWIGHYITSGGEYNPGLLKRRKDEVALYLWDKKKV